MTHPPTRSERGLTSREWVSTKFGMIVLKQVGFLWNRTVVVVVDELSSTAIDFIASERELIKLHLYGF